MKKIIIGLIFVAASISAGAQEFASYSRDNNLKVKSATTTGTGTVIGYEDDFIYILTSAQVTEGDAVTVSVKLNRFNAKKENSPMYSVVNTIPFVKDKALDLAVIKIHKAFLAVSDFSAGNHGFGTLTVSADTAGLMSKELGLTGFAGQQEEPSSATEKITAHSVNKDTKYFQVESDAHKEGYAGAMIGTHTTAVGMLVSNSDAAQGKAVKMSAILAFLKKNGVPHNLIKAGKLQ